MASVVSEWNLVVIFSIVTLNLHFKMLSDYLHEKEKYIYNQMTMQEENAKILLKVSQLPCKTCKNAFVSL